MLATAAVTFWRWLTGQPMPPAEVQAEERRVWLRFRANVNIRCEEPGGEEDGVFAVLCDISRGGVQLVAPRRFEPGTMLSVELPASRGGQTLSVLACVVRARPQGESDWAMGCRFSSELDDDQLRVFGASRAKPESPDPRGWSRFPCDARVFYQRVNGPDPAHHPARLLNISVGGMALLADEAVALGELLSTDLHDAAGRQVVTILACVVHVQSVAEGHILGCNFIRELDDRDVRALL